MTDATHRTPGLLLLLLAVGAAVLALALTRQGDFVNPDSCGYLSIASNLNRHEGFSSDIAGWKDPEDHHPVTYWPPLFPACIAAVSRVGISAHQAGLLVSAVGFGVLVGATGWVAGRLSGSGAASSFAAVLCIAWWPICSHCMMVLTESLFTALSMLAVWACLRARDAAPARWLGTAAGLVALALLTRYIGIALWGVFGLWCLWLAWSGKASWANLLWPAAAAAPWGGWLARNYFMRHGLTGQHTRSTVGLAENFGRIIRTMAADLVPIPHLRLGLGHYGTFIAAILGLLVVLGVLVVAAPLLKRGSLLRPSAGVLLVAGYTAAYLAVLLISASTRGFEAISSRYLMPVYPYIAVLAAVALAGVARHSPRYAWLGGAAGCGWLALLCVATLAGFRDMRSLPGFSRRMETSPSVGLLRAMDVPRFASDDPARLWYVTGRPVRYLPDPADPAQMRALTRQSGLHIVLFKESIRRITGVAGPADLRASAVADSVRLIADEPDCEIYIVR